MIVPVHAMPSETKQYVLEKPLGMSTDNHKTKYSYINNRNYIEVKL